MSFLTQSRCYININGQCIFFMLNVNQIYTLQICKVYLQILSFVVLFNLLYNKNKINIFQLYFYNLKLITKSLELKKVKLFFYALGFFYTYKTATSDYSMSKKIKDKYINKLIIFKIDCLKSFLTSSPVQNVIQFIIKRLSGY